MKITKLALLLALLAAAVFTSSCMGLFRSAPEDVYKEYRASLDKQHKTEYPPPPTTKPPANVVGWDLKLGKVTITKNEAIVEGEETIDSWHNREFIATLLIQRVRGTLEINNGKWVVVKDEVVEVLYRRPVPGE